MLPMVHKPCRRAPDGCLWRGPPRDHVTHRAACGFEADECPRCGVQMMRWKVHAHASECPQRDTHCPDCNATVELHTLEAHLSTCPSVVISCVCGASMARGAHAVHMADACPQREVMCGQEMLGCTFRGTPEAVARHEAHGACPFASHATPDWFPAVRDKLCAVLEENARLREAVTRLSGPEGQAIAKLHALRGLLRGGQATPMQLFDVRRRVLACRREWYVDELGLHEAAELADTLCADIADMLASQPGTPCVFERGHTDAFDGVFALLRAQGVDAVRVESNVAWEGGSGDVLVKATSADAAMQNYTVHSVAPRPEVVVKFTGGVTVAPTHVTLRSDSWGQTWYLTSFVVEGAMEDGGPWVELLAVHDDKASLQAPMKVHTFTLADTAGMYSAIRVRQTGNDAAGSSYLYLSGMELFGVVSL